jgi:hypothetical protein
MNVKMTIFIKARVGFDNEIKNEPKMARKWLL